MMNLHTSLGKHLLLKF